MFFGGRYGQQVSRKHGGNEQGLCGNSVAIERGFKLFVDDAFVCRVHVDDDQSLCVLRKDVGAVQLCQRVAEWWRIFVSVDRWQGFE